MDWAELETRRYYDYLNTIIKVLGCIKDAAEWLRIQGVSCNLTSLRWCSVNGQRSVGGYH